MGSTCTKKTHTNNPQHKNEIQTNIQNLKQNKYQIMEENHQSEKQLKGETETVVYKQQLLKQLNSQQQDSSKFLKQNELYLQDREDLVISQIEVIDHSKQRQDPIDIEQINDIQVEKMIVAKNLIICALQKHINLNLSLKNEIIENLDKINDVDYQEMVKSHLESSDQEQTETVTYQSELFDMEKSQQLHTLELKDIRERNSKFWSIISQIGKGTQGEVQKIFDSTTYCNYALKTFKDQTSYQHEKEINQQLKIKFPDNMLRDIAVELYSCDDQYFQLVFVYGVMSLQEFCEGKIKTQQYFEKEDIWYIMIKLVHNLKEIHKKGIFHSDIKPGNVLLFLENSNYNIKLGDFGVSTTNYQQITGYTIRYFPLKDFQSNKERELADLFGVGRVCQEILTRQLYHKGLIDESDFMSETQFLRSMSDHSEKNIIEQTDLLRMHYSQDIVDAIQQLLLQQDFKPNIHVNQYCDILKQGLKDDNNTIFNYIKNQRINNTMQNYEKKSVKDLVQELKFCLNELGLYDQAFQVVQTLENKGLEGLKIVFQNDQHQYNEFLMLMGITKAQNNENEDAIKYFKKSIEHYGQDINTMEKSKVMQKIQQNVIQTQGNNNFDNDNNNNNNEICDDDIIDDDENNDNYQNYNNQNMKNQQNQNRVVEIDSNYETFSNEDLIFLGSVHYHIGQNYNIVQNYKEAEYHLLLSLEYEKQVDLRVSRSSKNKLESYKTFSELGQVYMNLQQFEKAEKMFLQTYEMENQLLQQYDEQEKQEKQGDIATSFSNLASVYQQLKQYDKALEYDLKALEIYEIILPKFHMDLALAYNNLANTYSKLQNLEQAEIYYKKSLKIKETTLDPSDLQLAQTYKNLGVFYYNRGIKSKESEIYLSKALQIYQNHVDFNKNASAYHNTKIEDLQYCLQQIQQQC